ncbi:MAG TPA: NAD(P)H-dependent glycerol-3-phosphate dehydrogenase [Acidocella sp.]|jgi:glycerol-3-phosphate dehydrogenase (NAD(P)+)|uniref:NAD(P)H-dependent glycerol-3-phosphate dehydrogenase n=1 Tax=Acidocella sp. TaxID=50710 RepID=UPI002D089FA9|nr:NAD(P)H-dependent glycerol-3-phosphate dehydrogenase [Acidocella sp.]HVE21009.1 NAD(P)H-dependent glycerol-3-phosphate dehydrogenase [Acidocella sp.]
MNNKGGTIGVIGAGAWGTALAVLHARAGREVTLWARDARRASTMLISRRNDRLPGVVLPDRLRISQRIPDADIFLLTVPMQHLRATLALLPANDAPVVLCCKGLETGTALLPPEIVQNRPTAMLTGPNFAHEIAALLPAATVLATPDADLRARLTAALKTDTLRLYGSADIMGAALGGAAKNVIAIAAGVVIGAGLGENARAALITRGLAEIARLAAALGGRAETVSGLSGLGDLLLTCTGISSRNYSLGLALGQGEKLADILGRRSNVTEGVATAPALVARAATLGVDMPLTCAVTKLLAEERNVAQTMAALMGRELRDE